MKTVVWGKFIDINAYIKKKKKKKLKSTTELHTQGTRKKIGFFSQPKFRLRKEGLEQK